MPDKYAVIGNPVEHSLSPRIHAEFASATGEDITYGRVLAPRDGFLDAVRAFRAVGGTPPFIRSAAGAWLVDVDGKRYVDYVGSWGPMILGHAHPQVLSAVEAAAKAGLSYGAPTAAEVEMAEGGVDLVISDLGLPDGSGNDLMRELSLRYGLRGIALSGYGMDSDLEASTAAGFSRHLIKPVDIDDLRAAIREALGE